MNCDLCLMPGTKVYRFRTYVTPLANSESSQVVKGQLCLRCAENLAALFGVDQSHFLSGANRCETYCLGSIQVAE